MSHYDSRTELNHQLQTLKRALNGPLHRFLQFSSALKRTTNSRQLKKYKTSFQQTILDVYLIQNQVQYVKPLRYSKGNFYLHTKCLWQTLHALPDADGYVKCA